MTTAKTTTRRAGQRRTPAEKVAEGKARRAKQAAPTADAKPTRARFGPTECHAPGCGGERYLKGSLLCREHEAAWRAGTFRLSSRGWARLNAQKAEAAKPAGGRARKPAEPKPTAAAAFATPELAAKARAKRAAQRGRRS